MFRIEKKLPGKLGRAGVLETAHGRIHTPAFVPVGTKATVKALTPEQLKEIGVEIVLGNTYHLYLEPGEKVIQEAGGLGDFMAWEGPTMTDSGGFQVFSLGAGFGTKLNKVRGISVIPAAAPQGQTLNREKGLTFSRRCGNDTSSGKLVVIDEDGVTFRSPRDGSEHRFTPERSIEIQHALGADIIFAFDECTSPTADKKYQREAMERTHRWAARSLRRHKELTPPFPSPLLRGGIEEGGQMLFGIVQGGRFEDLRKESARVIGGMRLDGLAPRSGFAEFAGFGIGGSFEKEDMGNTVRWVNELLPEEKPRHLLGIGSPLDMFEAVENGCDLFDCVAPTREARTGALYTHKGRINIENAKYKTDFSPIETDCGCYTCKHFTRAYLAHLFRSSEILASTLATIHNLYFMVHLVKKMRKAILDGIFGSFREEFTRKYES